MHTATTDTLTCDTARLARWLDDPDYAYARGLLTAGEGPLARLRRWVGDRLAEWFDWTLNDTELNWVFVAVVVVCVLLLAWFVWHRHPGLFRSVGRNATPVAADEDTIYVYGTTEASTTVPLKGEVTLAGSCTWLMRRDSLSLMPVMSASRWVGRSLTAARTGTS